MFTLAKVREMLLTFGIDNDNLAVFLCSKFDDAQTDAIRITLAMATKLSDSQMDKEEEKIQKLFQTAKLMEV